MPNLSGPRRRRLLRYTRHLNARSLASGATFPAALYSAGEVRRLLFLRWLWRRGKVGGYGDGGERSPEETQG